MGDDERIIGVGDDDRGASSEVRVSRAREGLLAGDAADVGALGKDAKKSSVESGAE